MTVASPRWGLFAIGILALCVARGSHAFTVAPVRHDCFSSHSLMKSMVVMPSSSKLYMAKKRRRKTDSSSSGVNVDGNINDNAYNDIDDDDLPDFDLETEDEKVKPTQKQMAEEITSNMMGSSKPLGTIKDLLMDRSLEKKLQFDEPDDPLPDLAEIAAQSKSATQPVVAAGKKKVRKDDRRAAALAAAAEAEEEEGGFFSKIPFLGGNNEDGQEKLTGVKLLENGTWAGIFILVAWEVYLNSPLFDRAAPMAPVVYTFLL